MGESPASNPATTKSPHADHEHFACSCGQEFHTQEELKAHAQKFHSS